MRGRSHFFFNLPTTLSLNRNEEISVLVLSGSVRGKKKTWSREKSVEELKKAGNSNQRYKAT